MPTGIYNRQNSKWKPWIKGLHFQTNTGRTHFKKGHKPSEEMKQKISKKKKGKKFTSEHIENLRKSHKGQTAWNKGKGGYKLYPLSDEIKLKISKANKGQKRSLEARRKMSIGHLGKKLSDETKKKLSEINKGEKSFLWRGGKMANYSEMERIRKSFEYRLWRKSVFERDNFTCQKTGERGGKLIAHHINNFAEKEDLRLAIDNGITFSLKTHKEFHKKYGTKNNTKEQLEEFLNNL